jgi:8-oxo-dGTP diphosphatase
VEQEAVLAVGAVVVHDGGLLLVKRAKAPGEGRWSLPGGRVEPGESLTEAVAREVLEETGLTVIPEELLGWVERRSDDWHFVILDFRAVLASESGALVAADDAAAAIFCPLDEVRRLELVDGLGAFLDGHGVFGRCLGVDSLDRG